MERSIKKANGTEEVRPRANWTPTSSGAPIDPTMARAVEIGFMFFFWCATTTNVVCFLCYIIPQYFAHYSATSRNVFNLLIIFLHAHIVGHWFLVRYYESSVRHNGAELNSTHLNEVASDGENSDHQVDMGETAPQCKWTWKVCSVCQQKQPPRSHHCKVCNVCVLKRDHHCFMTGVCIGFWNQRHFIILNFYITLASILGFVSSYLYMTSHLGPTVTGTWDYLLPYMFYRWCTGQILLQHLLLSFLLYSFCWSPFVSLGFFATQMFITIPGKTLHETKKGLKVPCAGSVSKNLRSVFGAYWLLNFLFPVHVWFRQPGDGKTWADVQKDS